MKIKSVLLALFTSTMLALTTGCARDMGAADYTDTNTVGKVLEGTVVSARPVTIRSNDKLSDNTAGILGGGLMGGVAGASIGQGTGQGAAAIGGAIAGAALGSLAQKQLGKTEGMEYVVRLDAKYVSQAPTTVQRHETTLNDGSVDNQIKQSINITNTTTDLISVIQGKDIILQAGQRVLIIYHNDRPRLAPAI